jgi:hypothetical protein
MIHNPFSIFAISSSKGCSAMRESKSGKVKWKIGNDMKLDKKINFLLQTNEHESIKNIISLFHMQVVE